ncbi:Phosphodiest-domain-containing protein [Sistotremastrum suecicum HHB10207 ss-3]|uniref:Phosphodiest-domain-containing protein n=1 Tax=Sistotremastrum suecicum HHB10207 ss-3 TaxID=1314776 RepID=A0A166J771_9AGAM|nr:Phosphodiest-domain-containing protein [Sistotremastrum suecicum HHB10207 ss-3]
MDGLDFASTGGLRSNGTHQYRKTVLMISIDGLRADYLDRGFTPHLFEISQVGLRAKFMRPIFPTLTFPNHWSLLTGLYAESHGIVGNNFWDPVAETSFYYADPKRSWNSSWWYGEPIWETLERAGVKTANLMWIGPPETQGGTSPTFFIPWRDKVPLREKHDQIMEWIDLPLEERPQLILAYEPSLDQAGHSKGPGSKLVNDTLKQVDAFAKDIHSSLAARNLSDIVDVIFVSDHGMADTSHPKWLYLDDFIGMEGLADIDHEDGWPSMGLRFSEHCNATRYLEMLLAAAAENSDKFDVYTHETMPERYHFSENYRIAPIYVVPKLGYALTNRKESVGFFSKGNHGYDNQEPSMHAVFVADGPFVDHIKARRSLRQGIYVMPGFQNVEVKSLVGKLLGVTVSRDSHNGTEGFWEGYLHN